MSSPFETIHWTELAPTVAELYTADLLHAAMYDQLSARQVHELEQRLLGLEPATEPHATRLLSFLSGMAEAAFVRLVCTRAGVGYQPSFRVISGREFRQDTRGVNAREVDLVVVDTDKPGREPIVAIEAKFAASVNGKRKYCSVPEHASYSNQIICYPNGCVHPDLNAPRVRFVWLGLEADSARPMSRFKGAITDRDTDLLTERALQDQAEALWARATWEEVWEAIAAAVADHALAGALLRGLKRT
ncbi:hypothetical protein [Leifsonia sp. NCR5]|uniref:hypothetical protein n=1 Tax=Leifsonia sp. NCR5 TaxID=1978342 RepID=UPI000A193396|nr:hypothetical protein [Leifsonia sp. NCR5]